MHQPDSAADTSAGKMAHPAMLPRRGSSSSSSSNNVVPALGTVGASSGSQEDYSPPLLVQPPPPPPPAAASSSLPGPQPPPLAPPPPQSLTLLSQPPPPPQPLSQAGAQMKKKSGFQITSVTPAQISASLSSNNSIAEDTESYDDLDESHTEDLSSSEILDVSLSRATDLGEPERSSSEETLNNFQEAESPGAVSPNQPRPPQQQHPSLPHPPQQQSVVINGSVHGHHYHHHHHHHHHGHHHGTHSGMGGPAAPGGPPSSPSLRKLSAAGSSEGVVTAALQVSAASSSGAPATNVVSHFRTAGTPGVTSASGVGTNTLSSVGSGSPSVVSSVPSHVNKNLSNIPCTGSTAALSGASGNVNVTVLSGVSNGMGASSTAVSNTGNSASLSASHLQPATSTSRFRVVKLDSSSEPFKKGRWTCTEFYDKENPVSLMEGVASNKVVDTLKQNPLEVTSERESTSGSSVSSNVSTLSHYTESVGSGEMGASSVAQQQAFQGVGAQLMDLSSTGSQAVSAPSVPHSISQSQLAQVQLHPQDASYPQQKQGVQPPGSAVPSPVNIAGQQSTMPAVAPQQQLPYTQPMQAVQAVPVVPQPQPQQLSYGQGQAQHPAPPPQPVPMQMAPGHVKPVNQNSVTGPVSDYMQQQQQQQQQQQKLQTPVSSMQSGPTVVGTGTSLPVAQGASMQPSVQAHLPVASSQPVAHGQAPVQTVGANTQMMNVGQQGNVPPAVQSQQPLPAASQIAPSVMAQSAGPSPPPPSQVVPPVPAGIIHPGQQGSTPGISQPLIIAPQSTLLSMQAAESLVQGMTGQQMPPVSPVPPVSAVPAPCHSAANVPPTPMSLASSKTIPQSSNVQNGNLVQNVSQPSLISTGVSLPATQNVPQQIPLNSAQFSAQSLAQSIATREEARRSTEPTLVGLPHPTSGEGSVGASSSISDGGSSMAASLFPLKVLPLTSQLVDGEDERGHLVLEVCSFELMMYLA
uniref:TSC22 domain family protein 1 isoform X2 n=1 Tax=Pogona vitticeps TaxID=103695 RepID=A0A6J0U0B4_9SAUR